MNRDMNFEQLLAVAALNHELAQFVSEGLRGIGGDEEHSVALISGHAASNLLSDIHRAHAFGAFEVPKSKKDKAKSTEVETPAEFAFRQYVEFVDSCHVRIVTKVVPAKVSRSISDDQQAAIIAADTKRYMSVPKGEQPDSVLSAWSVAANNANRAIQRVGALLYLSSQRPRGLYGLTKEELDEQTHKCMQFLFKRFTDFRESELKFAIILGGAPMAETRAKIVDESFGEGMSVIQYLSRDEILPGSYRTKTESDLRTEISAYVQKAQA